MKKKIDKIFVISVLILVIGGFFIFTSASLGLLAKDANKFLTVATNQVVFGLVLGGIACLVTSTLNYKLWRRYSLLLFVASLILTALVFVPGIGWSHGGATRWISLGNFNFQPSEALKIGYLFYISAWYAKYRDKIGMFRYGLLPFIIITGLVGSIILLQPDNDTFFMIALAGFAIFFTAGAKWRDIFILIGIGLLGFAIVLFMRPYVMQRVMTYINPGENALSSGYQIQQSLIAIGSGGVFGKGFGQSTQKFGFLPEPIGDSIFAVAGEEFGFLGGILIISCFVFFALRGLKIATAVSDPFGGLLAIGIVILILAGSYLNIASMLGIIPLTGTPLNFISHGGTALFLALAEVGIIFNISKSRKKA